MTRTPTNSELLIMIEAMEKARALQATEYERRLSALNHEHARAKDTLNTYVPRELFDAYVKDQNARSEALALAVTLATGEKTGAQITVAKVWTAVGTMIAAMAVLTTIIIFALSR